MSSRPSRRFTRRFGAPPDAAAIRRSDSNWRMLGSPHSRQLSNGARYLKSGAVVAVRLNRFPSNAIPSGKTAAAVAACDRGRTAPIGLRRVAESVVRTPGCPLCRVRRSTRRHGRSGLTQMTAVHRPNSDTVSRAVSDHLWPRARQPTSSRVVVTHATVPLADVSLAVPKAGSRQRAPHGTLCNHLTCLGSCVCTSRSDTARTPARAFLRVTASLLANAKHRAVSRPSRRQRFTAIGGNQGKEHAPDPVAGQRVGDRSTDPLVHPTLGS